MTTNGCLISLNTFERPEGSLESVVLGLPASGHPTTLIVLLGLYTRQQTCNGDGRANSCARRLLYTLRPLELCSAAAAIIPLLLPLPDMAESA